MRPCLGCGKPMIARRSDHKYCCATCNQRGLRNHINVRPQKPKKRTWTPEMIAKWDLLMRDGGIHPLLGLVTGFGEYDLSAVMKMREAR